MALGMAQDSKLRTKPAKREPAHPHLFRAGVPSPSHEMEDQGRRRLRARTSYTKFHHDPIGDLLDEITPADLAACAAGLPPGRMTAEEKLRFKDFLVKKGSVGDYLDARSVPIASP